MRFSCKTSGSALTGPLLIGSSFPPVGLYLIGVLVPFSCCFLPYTLPKFYSNYCFLLVLGTLKADYDCYG